MSTQPSTEEKPTTSPAELPFNVDILLNCTARYTHKAWYLFYNNRNDLTFIREKPLRGTLTARTSAGAEELHKILTDAGVTSISRENAILSFTGTFEMIQKVIKQPLTIMLDVIPLMRTKGFNKVISTYAEVLQGLTNGMSIMVGGFGFPVRYSGRVDSSSLSI